MFKLILLLVCMVMTDFFTCGLAPFNDQFLLLCYEKSDGSVI
jgi:hypothetical protein